MLEHEYDEFSRTYDGNYATPEYRHEDEELVRLKHITGFSKLFADSEYKKSWETRKQILLKKEHKDEVPKG